MQLPSFKEQYAIVYDEYMDSLGGGERSALAYAAALKRLGFTTELISTRPMPPMDQVTRIFGAEFQDIPLKQIHTSDITDYYLSSGTSVFVNHTHMSLIPAGAKCGIYSQMFPAHPIHSDTHPKEVAALNTYKAFCHNSTFTQKYSDIMWDYPHDKSFVLHPPIGQSSTQKATQLLQSPDMLSQKHNKLIHIGRFNPGLHNKNQKIIIEAFKQARRRDSLLQSFELHLVGVANQTREAIQYLKECQQLANQPSDQITIHLDLPQGQLEQLLDESFGYIHGTGAFHLPGEYPEKCEHFGLSILEACAHGLIPLIYARGGIFDVLEPGENSIPYMTHEGLVEGMIQLAHLKTQEDALNWQLSALRAARALSQDQFTHKLAQIIKEVY